MHIDTQTTPVCVEIEGREYPLAPRTARLAEKLRRAEEAGLRAGRPHHRVEMAQLSLLLGRQAARRAVPAEAAGKTSTASTPSITACFQRWKRRDA